MTVPTRPPTVMGSRNGKPVLREEDLDTIASTSGLSEQQIRDDFDIFVKARLSINQSEDKVDIRQSFSMKVAFVAYLGR